MNIRAKTNTSLISYSSIVIDTITLRAPYSFNLIPGRSYGYNASATGQYAANLSEKIRVKGMYNQHHAQLRHSARSGELLLEGSAAGFLYGQNVLGNSNPRIAGSRFLVAACRKANIEVSNAQIDNWRSGDFDFHRLDIAINLRLSDDRKVEELLKQIARQLIEQHCQTWVMYRSVYWAPKKTEAYGITFYAKGAQLAARRYGRDDEILNRLEAECAGTLRIELRLRRPALLKMGLSKGSAWSSAAARTTLIQYLQRLPLLDVLSGPRFTEKWHELSPANRRAIVAVAANISLDQLYSASAVSKIKTDLKKKGLDIGPPYRPEPAVRLTSVIYNPQHLLLTPQWLIDARRAPRRRLRSQPN